MSLRQDVSFAARLLRRNPVFTATAVLSLAVGIAANAAIFSLADALLLRDRPGIADPDRLVDVGRSQDGEGFDNLSYANYVDFRDRNTVFTGLAAYRLEPTPIGLGRGDGAERVFGSAVSGNFFDVLGVRMAQGRGFRPEEDRTGGDNSVAVIGSRLWRNRFDADENVVGRTIRLNGRPFTVVGVTVEGFTGPSFVAPDLWIPLTAYPAATGRDPALLTNRAAVWLQCIGRLGPGVALEQARAEMTAIARDLERPARELHVVGLARDGKYRLLGEPPRAFIWVPLAQQYDANLSLLARTEGRSVIADVRAMLRAMDPNLPVVSAASLVDVTAIGLLPQRLAAWTAGSFGLVGLLLASIGVYGLTAYSVTQRTREIGVRIALGARRRDVLRLVIVQAMKLASGGAVAGLLAAAGATRLLSSLLYGIRPLDPVSFTGGAALFGALALLAAWLPASRAARVNPVEALRAE